jgi:4-hydroxy-4-methyl-2-oxoglutarate aldolase
VAEPGDVLVIAAAGTPCWLLGENQAHAALYRGLAGMCVDGCVRDTDEIAALPLPVFARGAGIRPYSTELELVSVNVPVAFAGMQVRPGDIVVGDGDGLLAIPAAQAGAVLQQILDIAGLEQEMEEAIKRQAPLEEIERLGKRKKIRKAE